MMVLYARNKNANTKNRLTCVGQKQKSWGESVRPKKCVRVREREREREWVRLVSFSRVSDVWGKPERKQILSRGKEQSHRGGVRFKNGFITLFYFFSCFLSLSNAHNLIFSLSLSLSLSRHTPPSVRFYSVHCSSAILSISFHLTYELVVSLAHTQPPLSLSLTNVAIELSLSLSLSLFLSHVDTHPHLFFSSPLTCCSRPSNSKLLTTLHYRKAFQ